MKNLFVLSTLLLSVNAFAATSPKCPGEQGYYFTNSKHTNNPTGGGFVAYSADVEDNKSIYIAPTAAICGSAEVSDRPEVYGFAVISGSAEVSGRAKVYGNAIVTGDSVVTDKARVYENAFVAGEAVISGKTRLKGWYKAIDEEISGGTHTAAQYTQAELNEIERQRQLALQKASEAEYQKNMKADLLSKIRTFYRAYRDEYIGPKLGFDWDFTLYSASKCRVFMEFKKTENVKSKRLAKIEMTFDVRNNITMKAKDRWWHLENDQGETQFVGAGEMAVWGSGVEHFEYKGNGSSRSRLDDDYFVLENEESISAFKSLVRTMKQYCGN